ncbi:tyrosinase family oxidase copper chaperone [Streptomyces sp. Tu 3180]|uniref:tyrosinase family oxidase copper chaperone n=1 Tax=Streptomyces sp. Tu 3180 TaxID=2682611 RepID=UPI0013570774|nr:tyrosinase family oxidase copper chaperone [Streptomyces sp. Tu 3180]KAF3465481.1 tyrosinase co-factor [Streptomyces sp. Tu 3180]
MIIDMGGAPAGAEDTAPDPAPPGPAGRTRRDMARGLRVCALAAALAPALTAFRSPRPRPPAGDAPRDTGFDVTHRGRRVRGVLTPARNPAEEDRWHVTVDGRPLHLMRRADGTWLSTVDHYCSYRTPLEAARAAVDALGPGERLREADAGQPHEHAGGRHGVRA